MSAREMSYDLDGIFSTRNQGQLVASVPTQTKMIRTPGLTPMKTTPMYRAAGVGDDVAAPASPTTVVTPPSFTLPILGKVPKTTVYLGLAAIAGAWFMMHKRA